MADITNIPSVSIVCMAAEIVLAIALPLVAIIFLHKKKKGSIIPVLIGAATFFVSAILLEGIFHSIFLYAITPIADFINSNFIVYVIYGSLMAGIFEETGRFVAFELMKKRYGDFTDAVSYGIGHGGFECAYVLGLTMFIYLAMALMINAGLGDMLFATMTEADMAALEPVFESIATITPGLALAAVAERISAMTLHVCNSVVVYNGVKNGKISRLFIAIAIHAAFNMVALFMNQSFGIAATEIMLFVFAAALAFYVFKIRKGEI